MQLKTITQVSYNSPKVEVIETKVEQGFATSVTSKLTVKGDHYDGEEEW